MAIDPVDAAVEAIAAHLESVLGPDGSGDVAKVIRGWPEDDEVMDLTAGCQVSVTPGEPQITDCSAKSLGSTEADGVTTYTYRTGWMSVTMQIDLWAPHRYTLRAVGLAIYDAMRGTPPKPPIKRILSTDYYGRPLDCTISAGRDDFDGDTAAKGEWRRSWDLTVTTDIVTQTTHVPQNRVDLEVTVNDDTANAETITAFQ